MGIEIIILCITGAIAAAIAASKGRSAIGWFFIGFFLGLIGVIVAAVMSNLKAEEELRAQAQAERRRLREQLRQEKMKTEAFRQHAAARLDAHDGALGLDTRQTPGLAAGQALRRPLGAGPGEPPPEASPPASEEAPPVPEVPGEPGWYYEADGDSLGPVPQSTLVWMIEAGTVSPDTLVWTEGQTDWQAARNLPAFRDAAPG